MPVKNGWETFEQLAQKNPLLPIIVITARPNQIFPALAAGVGALAGKAARFAKTFPHHPRPFRRTGRSPPGPRGGAACGVPLRPAHDDRSRLNKRVGMAKNQCQQTMVPTRTINECAGDKTTHNRPRAFKRQTGRSCLHDQHQRSVCPDLKLHFRIERSMKTPIHNRTVDLAPRPMTARRLTATINKP